MQVSHASEFMFYRVSMFNVLYRLHLPCCLHSELTDLGVSEAKALNSMLDASGWFKTLTGGKPTTAVVSPLSRCLQTCMHVLDKLPLAKVQVEENIRETLGEDTCDARR